MNSCKVCDNDLKNIVNFGPMPISNRFLPAPPEEEFLYELSVGFCSECYMVQLEKTVDPEMMFNENYAFFSSTSKKMENHFDEMAEDILEIIANQTSPFVIEIGCNDGIMLKNIAKRGIHHLGMEPSGNVAERARENGVEVFTGFFNGKSALDIMEKHGEADVISGANVMCHIENINSVLEGAAVLLKNDGVMFFEDPYLLDIVKKTSFDQIYDEHVFYFCGLSISELAQRNGLQLVDMAAQGVHGGSMRYFLKKGSKNRVSENVTRHISAEREFNLHTLDGYLSFQKKVNKISADLRKMLVALKEQGQRIAAYGATSKSTTLLNFSKIGPELIDYICDTTPTKIGKYTPGTHIPIKSHQHFQTDSPPYTLLLAWNHQKEIFAKELEYRKKGGKFITFFPGINIK